MLEYKFDRILKARGIERVFTFLVEAGFSASFATKVKKNRINQLELRLIEKLCIVLKCTPNDFMEWKPDNGYESDKKHPLNAIRKNKSKLDLLKTINSLPLSKIDEVNDLISKELKS